jgi:hypothetical protein
MSLLRIKQNCTVQQIHANSNCITINIVPIQGECANEKKATYSQVSSGAVELNRMRTPKMNEKWEQKRGLEFNDWLG